MVAVVQTASSGTVFNARSARKPGLTSRSSNFSGNGGTNQSAGLVKTGVTESVGIAGTMAFSSSASTASAWAGRGSTVLINGMIALQLKSTNQATFYRPAGDGVAPSRIRDLQRLRPISRLRP